MVTRAGAAVLDGHHVVLFAELDDAALRRALPRSFRPDGDTFLLEIFAHGRAFALQVERHELLAALASMRPLRDSPLHARHAAFARRWLRRWRPAGEA